MLFKKCIYILSSLFLMSSLFLSSCTIQRQELLIDTIAKLTHAERLIINQESSDLFLPLIKDAKTNVVNYVNNVGQLDTAIIIRTIDLLEKAILKNKNK